MLCGWLPTRILKEEKLNAQTALLIIYLFARTAFSINYM